MLNKYFIKTVALLLATNVLLPITCYSQEAVNWDALGFPDQATSKDNYNETFNVYNVDVKRKKKDSLGVFPVNIHSITGGGTPPIVNSSPFPTFDITGTDVDNNPNIKVKIKGATATDSILDPGQYLFVGGIDTNSVVNIDKFKFKQIGGGFTTSFVATPTFEVDTTETDALTWNPVPGTLTFTPSGTSGVIFLRNTSGVAINEIKFEVDYNVVTSFYFGTTTPEPSTYLILGGLLITCIVLVKRKRKKLSSNT